MVEGMKDMTKCHCPASLGNKHLEACPCFKPPHDPVKNPAHYTSHPSGVEQIQVSEHMSFCLGNAIKYLWRAGLKGDAIEDLRKAVFYIEREIARLQKT
jgi:hypothetical protein